VITNTLQEALGAIINDPKTATTAKEMAQDIWDDITERHADIKQALHVALMKKNKKQHCGCSHKSQEE
jgi:hypothetical protein